MAISTPTGHLGAGSNTNATSYATGSATYTNGRLYCMFVWSGCGTSPNQPGVTGGGVTWVVRNFISDGPETDDGNFGQMVLLSGICTSTTTGTLTIDFSGQTQKNCGWSVMEIASGFHTTTPVRQTTANWSLTPAMAGSATLSSAIKNSESYLLAGILLANDAASVPETPNGGATTVHEVDHNQSGAEGDWCAKTSYNANTNTGGWTWTTTNEEWFLVIAEIQDAEAPVVVTPTTASLVLTTFAPVWPRQYWTTFTEYTTGVQPSDWTEIWNTGMATATVEVSPLPPGAGAKALKVVGGGGTSLRYGVVWNKLGEVGGDVEVYSRWNGSSGVDHFRAAMFHASGSIGSENAYVFRGLLDTSPNIFKYVAGSLVSIAGGTPTLTGNVWWRTRFQKTGNTIRVRVWLDADAEPVSWTLVDSDTSLNVGKVGVSMFDSIDQLYIDWFSVGTAGLPALEPLEPVEVVPAKLGLVTTKFTPLVFTPRRATPTTVSLVLSTFAPVIAISDAQVVTPPAIPLVLTTFAPTVVAPVTVTPATAALVLSTFVPAISIQFTFVPTTVALVLTTFAPSTGSPSTVVPGKASLVLTSFAPNLSTYLVIITNVTPNTVYDGLTGVVIDGINFGAQQGNP